MTDKPSQLDGLTGLRGIAAWFVVFYHIRSGAGDWLPPAIMALCAKGYLAVDLFFMLSGFVIWLNYAPWFQARGWGGYGSFLQKRLARVWPLHATVLIAMIGLASVLAATGRTAPQSYPWPQLPLHFALMQNWGLTHELSWNHPAWSISTEFAAYLTFPLLVLVAKPNRWPIWAQAAAIGALGLGLHLLMTANGAITLGNDIAGLGLYRCLVQFAMGALICLIWQKSAPHPLTLICTVLFVAIAALWLTGYWPETLAFPLAIAPLLLALAHGDSLRWNILRARPLVWLGEISYSTYLVHFAGWIIFKLLFVRDAAHVPIWQTAVFMALVLVGSIISYRLIEQPGRRWMAGLHFGRAKALG
jgi:peptidoglycan/LPS O-acetylase OafA/YrhL